MTDLQTLRQRLQEAEGALHRLMMGELEVTVSVTGYGATNYNSVNKHQLETYIGQLKGQIAKQSGHSRRGPLFIKF